MEKGYFIVFEGIEGCGKTTQAKLLADEFKKNGFDVVLTKEPGGTELGKEVRNLLLHASEISPLTELFLFLADREEHIEKIIKPALKQKKIIISDRYFYSTLAYQIGGRKMDRDLVVKLNKKVVRNFLPDIVFYLDISVEEAFLRKKDSNLDRIEKESFEFHNNIRNEYLNILGYYDNIIKIDALLSVEEIHKKIWNLIREKFLIKYYEAQ